MKPGVYNIEAKQGATWRLPLTWKDQTGVPVVLTGYSARLVVGYADGSTTAVLECSTANGRIALGGTLYNVIVSSNRELMLALTPGNYVYDLELSSATGEDYPLLTGRFVVSASKMGA